MSMKKIIISIFLFVLLQGCASNNGNISNDNATPDNRGTLRVYYDDSNIHFAITQSILRDPELKYSHIVVAVYRGVVLLAGQVSNSTQSMKAQQISNNVSGVKRVFNQITISGPTSTLTRSSDAYITSKVKSNMVMTQKLNSQQIKVVTENGVVYLMGDIPSEQVQLATSIARHVTGVQKVVTLFGAG